MAGSTPVGSVAKWDGAAWSPPGTGVSGGAGARTLTVFSNRLCVGGYFASAGGLVCSNFAVWDGANWQVPITSITGSGSAAVLRLAALGDRLYLGGIFSTLNGVMSEEVIIDTKDTPPQEPLAVTVEVAPDDLGDKWAKPELSDEEVAKLSEPAPEDEIGRYASQAQKRIKSLHIANQEWRRRVVQSSKDVATATSLAEQLYREIACPADVAPGFVAASDPIRNEALWLDVSRRTAPPPRPD